MANRSLPFSTDINAIYDVGIKHGLDVSYVDACGCSIAPYYLAVAEFSHIFSYYKKYVLSENIDFFSAETFDVFSDSLYRFGIARFCLSDYSKSPDDLEWQQHEASLVSQHSLFGEVMKYSEHLILYSSNFGKREFFSEFSSYCKSLHKN